MSLKSINLKRLIIIFSSVVVLLVVIFLIVINSQFGHNLIRLYFEKEIHYYFPSFKIKKFDVNYNNFSMLLEDNKNSYKLDGKIYPFNAVLEGYMKNFKIADKLIENNILLSGNVIEKKKKYEVNANVYFGNNIGNLVIELNKNEDEKNQKNKKLVIFKAQDVDINYFIKRFPLPKLKDLKAKVDIFMMNKDNKYVIHSRVKGIFENYPLIARIKFLFSTLNKVLIEGKVNSPILDGKFNVKVNRNQSVYTASFNRFPLNLVNIIYPFKGIVNLDIKKDKLGIIKFKSSDFSGFEDSEKFNLVFKTDINKFFNYLNLKNVFSSGVASGRILINNDKNGSFNFIIENAKLLPSIAKKLHISDNKFEKVFVKGNFDAHRVIFTLLAANQKLTVTIKNGNLFIKEKIIPSFVVIVNNGKEEFYYKVNKKGIIFLKRRDLENQSNQILVF